MLEAIADFWKPAKKGQPQEKLQPEQLQVGSTIGFGFVPQGNLSGRRLVVSAINTYQFGEEKLTSFVLSQDKDAGVSMIVAEAEGEQYLAISRRIVIADRMKLFESIDLENVVAKPEVTKLPCKEGLADFRGWVVPSYKREIQSMKGRLFKGDLRKAPAPDVKDAQEFEYTLLVSDSNEHAIEIEKYRDGRLEVYATVYRRLSDVGEIIAAPGDPRARPDIKLASGQESAAASPGPAPVLSQPIKPAETPKAVAPAVPQAPPTPPAMPATAMPVKTAATMPQSPMSAPAAPAQVKPVPPTPVQATPPAPITRITPSEEKFAMTATTLASNGATSNQSTQSPTMPRLNVQPTAPETYFKQEVKTVNNGAQNTADLDAIECDLRVANKIIDEAIRNEMRLTDVVRRIIELPVAYQEAVQIPVTLTDEDYALLAIRYGIPASDRNAIKRRIIEDLDNFSGNGGAKKLAA